MDGARDWMAQIIREHERTESPIETCKTCGEDWDNEADDFADHIAAALVVGLSADREQT